MKRTYAVTWQEGGGDPAAGRLELDDVGLRLAGIRGDALAAADVGYAELSAVAVARSGRDRLGGRPTLVLSRHGAPVLRVASIAHQWIVAELADHLGGLAPAG